MRLKNNMQRLIEIDIIRSCVIVALIGCHAFAPFAGTWESPLLITSESTLYYWLAKFFYSGMLETFVFISGYVYALGDIKHNYTIRILIKNKIRRLYVPCLFWGCICIIVYHSFNDLFSSKMLLSVINGLGHLWFLPMLFWCFIIEKIFCRRIIFSKIWILILIAILPCPELPLRINNSLYYILFFHLGYMCFLSKTKIFNILSKYKKYFGFVFCIYLFCFVLGTYMVEYTQLTPEMDIFTKMYISPFHKLSRLFYSIMAVGLYFVVGYILSSKLSDRWLRVINRISLASFAIYILQEPILRILYYKTSFCQVITPVFYPWIASFLTLILSYMIFILLKKNSVFNNLF